MTVHAQNLKKKKKQSSSFKKTFSLKLKNIRQCSQLSLSALVYPCGSESH